MQRKSNNHEKELGRTQSSHRPIARTRLSLLPCPSHRTGQENKNKGPETREGRREKGKKKGVVISGGPVTKVGKAPFARDQLSL
jgi:hypothetical protein